MPLRTAPEVASDRLEPGGQRRRLFCVYPLLANIGYLTNGALSNYNAVTVAVNKRMSRGLLDYGNVACTRRDHDYGFASAEGAGPGQIQLTGRITF